MGLGVTAKETMAKDFPEFTKGLSCGFEKPVSSRI